ncbi:MFP1 attachment factor 1 [Striga asiatica]|uniref:MFP1 attachment factor 1 n=1 Tax=Striga asiatica TaxID=4170 RepID=A0A5A7Q4T0_STRAF|nr:MFP1 attachment factor 1 [Striga asiatica]
MMPESDNIETPLENPQTKPQPSSTTAMAETELPPPQSDNTTASVAEKLSNISFSIWPPSERTRDAVRHRLIETLSSPSILSKRYGTVPREEAADAAKVIEEEAFEVAGKGATADDDGIEILQVYSKEISKRMLERVKARSGEQEAPAASTPQPPANKPEEEDAAPPHSEKTESAADDE